MEVELSIHAAGMRHGGFPIFAKPMGYKVGRLRTDYATARGLLPDNVAFYEISKAEKDIIQGDHTKEAGLLAAKQPLDDDYQFQANAYLVAVFRSCKCNCLLREFVLCNRLTSVAYDLQRARTRAGSQTHRRPALVRPLPFGCCAQW